MGVGDQRDHGYQRDGAEGGEDPGEVSAGSMPKMPVVTVSPARTNRMLEQRRLACWRRYACNSTRDSSGRVGSGGVQHAHTLVVGAPDVVDVGVFLVVDRAEEHEFASIHRRAPPRPSAI